MFDYTFGRKGSVEYVTVISDTPHELEGHQVFILEADNEKLTHVFDIVGELNRVEFCNTYKVWYSIENHYSYTDRATKMAETNSKAIDDILVMILEG